MRKSSLVLVAMSALVLATSLVAADKEKDKLADVKCPVSGKAVQADKTADYRDAKVYFCCPNCPKAFAKNTAKFAIKANHQLVQTGQFKQVKCPLAGRDLNEKQTVKVNGVKVAFCCGNCKGKVAKAEGDKQLELVFADKPFEKGFELKKEKK